MARCRCGLEQCVCVLEAGAGLRLEGSGSPSNPWVLFVDPVSTGTIKGADTASVDLIRTGSGTVADPYILAAQAMIAPLLTLVSTNEVQLGVTGSGIEADPMVVTPTLPWVDPVPGLPGDVLTKQADGTYAAGPAAVAAPGMIIIGVGLQGDGSLLAPLRVRLRTYGDLKNVG